MADATIHTLNAALIAAKAVGRAKEAAQAPAIVQPAMYAAIEVDLRDDIAEAIAVALPEVASDG